MVFPGRSDRLDGEGIPPAATGTGYGWLYAEDKETGGNIGAIGLLYTRDMAGEDGWELGYIVNKRFWAKGYAAEGAGVYRARVPRHRDRPVFSQMRTSNARFARGCRKDRHGIRDDV